jgi:outer membrane protein
VKVAVTALLLAAICYGQQRMTLTEAEQLALRSHPAIQSTEFMARAAAQAITEARSPLLPQAFGSVTGAGALTGSRLAAGALNNPVIYDRFASGVTASQLITDFGRTSNLISTARLHAEAQDRVTDTAKDQVLLAVDASYFGVLRAQAVLTVAEQTVRARQLVADQVKALTDSKLKSSLDLSFANVNLAEAKLELANAGNDVRSAVAEFSAALGFQTQGDFQLAEEPLPPNLSQDLNDLINEAIRNRPELASLRADLGAAEHFAVAEKDLSRPTISTAGSFGYIPVHQSALTDRYAAVGINVNIPIFNGRLFQARQSEAELRARAAAQNVKDFENRVARDVRVAYLNAVNAYERLGLPAQRLDQAKLAMSLAQSRYDLGLGSIVELSQAQLNETSAEIVSTRAKYDYQARRAVLAYQAGTIR